MQQKGVLALYIEGLLNFLSKIFKKRRNEK